VRIAHFYHVYAGGAWAPAVTEHAHMLEAAGFPAQPLVGVTGPAQDRSRFCDWAEDCGWKIVAEADEGFEQLTLNALRAWLATVNGRASVLYAHTKGASTDLGGFNSRWRQEMTLRLAGEWRTCVQLLEHHDAVGCCWKNKGEFPQLLSTFAGSGIFAGNFWWATDRYLRRLPEPGEATRHDAEAWIGLGEPDVIDMLPGWLLHLTGDGSVITADLNAGRRV
jgi:hypothetical protein